MSLQNKETHFKPLPASLFAGVTEEQQRKVKVPENLEYKIQRYLKVGLFCGWNWHEFEETPDIVVDYISEEIDLRLEPYNKMAKKASGGSKSGGGMLPLNFFHLALLLALSALFGGSKDKDEDVSLPWNL